MAIMELFGGVGVIFLFLLLFSDDVISSLLVIILIAVLGGIVYISVCLKIGSNARREASKYRKEMEEEKKKLKSVPPIYAVPSKKVMEDAKKRKDIRSMQSGHRQTHFLKTGEE